MHPAAVIGREASRRNDAVDMRMGKEVLGPGVENAEDPDLRAEVLRIRRDFQEGGGRGSEQEVVKLAGIVERQQVEFVRKREDDVEVSSGQQLLFPCGKPALARLGLTLGAVPVTTRIIRDGLKSALGAGIEMPPERGGAAVRNGSESLELLEIQARSIPVKKTLALHAEDFGHLHGGSSHFLCKRRER